MTGNVVWTIGGWLVASAMAWAPAVAADLDQAVEAYQRGDFATAIETLRPLADQGDAMAQFYLGFMYETGKGVEADPAAAADWYRRSAEQGQVKAQLNLGLAYANARGVERNHEEALAWLRKAAEQNHARAQYKIAEMYEQGVGTEQDLVQAYLWFKLAGQQRYEDARKRRKRVAKRMDPYAIAEADMLVRHFNAELEADDGSVDWPDLGWTSPVNRPARA